ncbi:LacI family DNA-binding transcriptional regulator [Rhodobacteraceae bacterium N5(2021)]|uniref:LacI family DNA-binding transcriptional regulator n=1 Tax=Gymnodinialimonas phycosphaerae TaxID=2841589 RepID=A0A975TVI7_9RHOB|nr:LacI family DNA-binding transcriptional regulator [Gymnodinialimonas phycosphaerae]MBY4891261.1 LacI family DNA-binding transcriptional regulator [Gymnodinialimonas phycosphaerae]
MMPTRPAPTLSDVAKRSGFSTATVSRCLNFPDQVSDKTRMTVMAAIADLGYSPNFGARAMAAQRTNTIGAIIPTMENAIFARGIQAFQEELNDHGYNLMVASSSYRMDLEESQIRSLVARGADALLLVGYQRDPAIYQFLEAQNVPALVTWAYAANGPRPSVGFDNRRSMEKMAKEVLRLGHRRLAVITAETASNDRAAARLQGIRDAMGAAGLADDDLRVIETPYGIDTGGAAFASLMQESQPPTAVLCGNDVLAVGALGRARDLGVDVPGDVSIVGFDDIELAQVAYPKLTTVHVPHREMGRKAARALIGFLQGGTPIEAEELKAEVYRRESLGPAPR